MTSSDLQRPPATSRHLPSPPVTSRDPRSDGLVCDDDELRDASEVVRLGEATLDSFDKLFASVSAAEMREGLGRLRGQ